MSTTQEAVLFCEAEKNFKDHNFEGIEQVSPSKKEEGYNLIYQCTSCGSHRVWGNTEYLSLDIKKAIKKLKN